MQSHRHRHFPLIPSNAVIQCVFLPLGTQAALPWATQPLMRDAIYIPLLVVTFMPGASVPLASTLPVVLSAANLFIFAALWSGLMVRIGI